MLKRKKINVTDGFLGLYKEHNLYYVHGQNVWGMDMMLCYFLKLHVNKPKHISVLVLTDKIHTSLIW